MKDESTLCRLASFWNESNAEFLKFVAGGEDPGICGNAISWCGQGLQHAGVFRIPDKKLPLIGDLTYCHSSTVLCDDFVQLSLTFICSNTDVAHFQLPFPAFPAARLRVPTPPKMLSFPRPPRIMAGMVNSGLTLSPSPPSKPYMLILLTSRLLNRPIS